MASSKPRRVLYVLSSDPGSANHGIAVTKMELIGTKLKVTVLGNARLDRAHLPQDFQSPYPSYQKYARAVEKFFRSCVPKHVRHPSVVAIERFQARGIRGSQGELVSFMIATQVIKYGTKADTVVLTASTWKNQVNRIKVKLGSRLKTRLKLKSDKYLDYLYALNKGHGTNHQLDAVLLGIYSGCKVMGVPYYPMLQTKAERTKLLTQVKKSVK